MFRGNVPCVIERSSGTYDKYGQTGSYDAPLETSCLVLKNKTREERTSVRFDTSASRGHADEIVGEILIGLEEAVKVGDKITLKNVEYAVVAPPYELVGRNGCTAYNEVIIAPRQAR